MIFIMIDYMLGYNPFQLQHNSKFEYWIHISHPPKIQIFKASMDLTCIHTCSYHTLNTKKYQKARDEKEKSYLSFYIATNPILETKKV